MARFQSRLFNWIDTSLAAKLGRKAREWYEQIGNPVKQAAESIKKTTTRAVLYPMYILASATIRTKSQEVPLLLKPVQSLVVWMDRNKIFAVEKSIKSIKTINKYRWVKSVKPDRNSKKSRNPNFNVSVPKFLLGDKPATLATNNYDRNYERIQKLIKDAIAYFFGNKPRNYKLKSTKQKPFKSDKNKSWLTMADVFDDHEEVWPPLITKSNELNRSTIVQTHTSSHELSINPSAIASNTSKSPAPITTSTSQGLTDSMVPATESSRPMHAWIETQATFLGYVYNPFRQLLEWLDRLIANIEKSIIKLWQQVVTLVCRLF